MYQITESNNKLLAKAMSKFNIPSLLIVFIFFGSYFLYVKNQQTLIDELLKFLSKNKESSFSKF